MPLASIAGRYLVAFSLAAVMTVPAGVAHAAPGDVPGVMAVCDPVITEEYAGNTDRWGQCIEAVKLYLDAVGAPSAATDETISELVVALTELYEQGRENCRLYETELPQAIEHAAHRVTDNQQEIQILEISATIRECPDMVTAAVSPPASPS